VKTTVCVSDHQANRLKKLTDSVVTIGNGIVPEVFLGSSMQKKIPGRCIWTSAWNRGLIVLLKIWPEVQQAYPDATLHVYGCNDDTRDPTIEEELNNLSQSFQVRVFGKANNGVIAQAMQEADIFAYPSTFVETFCTSALEAQMAGCLCIVSDIGALPETVGDRGLIVSFDRYFTQKFAMAVIENIGMQPWTMDLRGKAMEWAAHQTWTNRGEAWAKLLEG
jgi:glycosyltransferase involved in cell wall biosynthesis